MVIIANIGGADIGAGDFVIANRLSSSCVCYISSLLAPNQLEVVWWSEVTEAPPICPNTFPNLLQSNIVEISAEHATSVIHCNDITDIAFVFTAEVIEHWWTDLAGMTRVFFTRATNHVSFNPNVLESYPSRVWHSLLSVKETVRKLMSKKRQMHVCRSSTSTTLPLEGWRYLSIFLPPIHFEKNQTKAIQFPDLSLQSKSSIQCYSIKRIISPALMATARQLLGTTFGIGTRNIPPRKGLPKKVMEVGNIVNVVNVSEFNPPNRFKEFIPDQRIDLVYEEASRSLSVRVVYSDFKAEHKIISNILKFPRFLGTPEANGPAP